MSSKLYTEEQISKAIDNARYYNDGWVLTEEEIITSLNPIELPSDEDIEKQNPFVWGSHVFGTRDLLIWEQGAKWMRDKIGGK